LTCLPAGRHGFDVVIACDLLFARAQHVHLLNTIQRLLVKSGVCWVAFSHHDPHKGPLDMAFFEKARSPPFSFSVTLEERFQYERDNFVERDGLDEERAVVHFYSLRHSLLRAAVSNTECNSDGTVSATDAGTPDAAASPARRGPVATPPAGPGGGVPGGM
jgi:hypothetical protein